LTKDEEKTLLPAMASGCAKARERLILGCVQYAAKMAAQYARHAPHRFEEAFNAAMQGVTIAADKFDATRSKDCRFLTYASFWVKKCLMDWAHLEQHAVRLPRHKWQDMEHERITVLPLDAPINDKGATVLDLLEAEAVEEQLESSDAWEIVLSLLPQLSEYQQKVIRARFGLGETPKRLADLAAERGCTSERIRQIEAKAIRKLRRLIYGHEAVSLCTA
jgi:RNA polymerase primary sigma factor